MNGCLEQGELVRLDCTKAGHTLDCMSGAIWVTCGDGRDYLLSAGRSLVLSAGVTVVVEAIREAEYALVERLVTPHRTAVRDRTVALFRTVAERFTFCSASAATGTHPMNRPSVPSR
jgi:Protein of unknown function (DUF2917)